MPYINIKDESAWEFKTSGAGGLGLGIVVAEGGILFFKDPGGQNMTFRYGAAGVGYSIGLKLPKIGKLQLKGRGAGAAAAPPSFYNVGKLYILDSFKGNELTKEDIRGVCAFVQLGAGVVAGGSDTALLVGMNPVFLAASIGALPVPLAMVFFQSQLVKSATGLLMMRGLNVGVQAGFGSGIYLGGLY